VMVCREAGDHAEPPGGLGSAAVALSWVWPDTPSPPAGWPGLGLPLFSHSLYSWTLNMTKKVER
jgi:hypothetical protein